MLTPALLGLREKYPKAKIAHVTGAVYMGAALVDVFSHLPKGIVDELHVIEPYDGTTARTRDVWAKFYRGCPDIEELPWWQQADLHFDFNTPCVDYEWGAMRSPEGIQKSRTQVWCDFADVQPSTMLPQYVVDKHERKWATKLYQERGLDPAKVVGVGVNACDEKRAMGRAKVAEICDRLHNAGLQPVVLDATVNIDGHPAFNGMRLSETMALIEQMKLVISVDSGILHMAGALKVPVIGIFGPTDAFMRMGPYVGSAINSRHLMPCAPCWYDFPCLHNSNPTKPFACLHKITAEMIVEEALRWTRSKPLRVVQ